MSDKKLSIAILGSGKGSNCQSILDAISRGELAAEVVCVLSDVPDAFILERAASHGIPAQYVSASPFQTKLDGDAEREYVRILREHKTDVVVLAGFMRIIKAGLLQAFPDRILNIHPSLLPAFPGLAAWKQALEYGVKITGCTVHLVNEGMDTGPIIVQRSVPVLDDDTAESLHARIQVEEHVAYPQALKSFAAGLLRFEGRRIMLQAPK